MPLTSDIGSRSFNLGLEVFRARIAANGRGDIWICPYISRHLLSLNPLLACCRRYSRGER
ncbi:T3SS effector NleG [Escherichia coli]|nr:T3SS effector NleG [Escherichia coli]